MKQAVSAICGGIALSLCASTATAMHLNPNGLGQVLVYPYYTVNGGYTTFVTITNSTTIGKAIKVRLLEGYNGRDVQDFNLYLSPHDYWVGAVIDSGNGGAAIFANDTSCTVPTLPTTVQTALPFTTTNFDGTGAQAKDGGPIDATRTREGHIEIIEMGTVTSSATLDAISHAANGVPENCPSIVAAWASGGQWTLDPTKDIGPPSGGLFGNGVILNVANGTVFSYPAEAIAQFYAKDGRGEHSRPDSLTPNISSATSATADICTDDGSLSLTYSHPVDAVSAVFMADKIQNEYWTSKSIAAASEWVITYPTKRFYVDPYFAVDGARAPFDIQFTSANGGTALSPVDLDVFNREQMGPISFGGFGQPPLNLGLAYETQIVTFGQQQSYSKIVASQLVTGIYSVAPFENGWAELNLAGQYGQNHRLVAANGNVLIGQPVTGFWINQLVNGSVNGVLANYTALYRHRLHVSCARADSAPCL